MVTYWAAANKKVGFRPLYWLDNPYPLYREGSDWGSAS